ncbi:hypothetical protein FHQ18_06750 [Deferribacter autotrophicus]|uniref:Uncharacterized protein n=1 Tax=Deferribacter autotrophicus TaxID=500465 RepID=A0A5A8F3P9_9BACT|nr:hypothetical protein [Deferribacter autotrophicus]KAA0258091.1 hypothetical protein FHQ18_06750 [Deferribacter autotrophicus]
MRKITLFLAFLMILGQGVAKADKDLLLESLGTFIASDLLSSYVAIGSVSDLYAYGKYSVENTKSIINFQKQMIKNKQDAIKKLIDAGDFEGSDISFGYQVIEVYGYLDQESAYLLKYIESKEHSDADNFQYFRKKAWAGIKSLLGIQ